MHSGRPSKRTRKLSSYMLTVSICGSCGIVQFKSGNWSAGLRNSSVYFLVNERCGSMVDVLYISEKDAQSSGLDMRETVEIAENVFRAHGEGKAIVPAKLSLELKEVSPYPTWGNAMSAYFEPWSVMGLKWIGANSDNPSKHQLPTLMGAIMINDPQTFAPIAILGAAWITAMRTAAATAVCAKYLAKKNSKTLCIIGAGFQGRHQLLALQEVLPLTEVRVHDTNPEAMNQFVEQIRGKSKAKLNLEKDASTAVKGADVVVIAITNETIFFKQEWIEKGMLICSLGETVMEYHALRAMDKIIVDHRRQTTHMGELKKWFENGLISERDVYAELGEIVAGKKPGRENDQERILAAPIGVASLDVATAFRVYIHAKQKGIGTVLSWI
jgi:ornithine cyclodeaminase/alanine dehydrogenase-like protein (mu-crystallin family)